MKKQIPNVVTLLNLLCGCISIYFTLSLGDLKYAALFILLGAVFDFFDGMVARLLNVLSPMGKELDSLADVVTFGAAPGFIAFNLIHSIPLAFAAFLIPILSAYRLAKFNIDERQTSSFIGLPTPPNALFWVSIAFLLSDCYTPFPLGECFFSNLKQFFSNEWILFLLAIIFSILLISNIPLFSLKFKNLKWKENKIQFIFLISSGILILLVNMASAIFIIILYLIFSIIKDKSKSLQ